MKLLLTILYRFEALSVLDVDTKGSSLNNSYDASFPTEICLENAWVIYSAHSFFSPMLDKQQNSFNFAISSEDPENLL